MALREQQYPIPYEQDQIETSNQPIQKVKRKKLFTTGEKMLFVMFASILTVFSVVLLHREGQINDVNREVQSITHQLEQTKKDHTELSIQVKEQSTYDKIWEKAKKLGLHLNEQNVKVVPGR
ncbi:MAG TPA: cell division protein FtsL [Sporosarcina sp.]|nr:cell division protein FtsL [Sporosarcina sp.]